MAGQILLDSPFGDALRRLAALDDVKTILEVGTWSGYGSTLCLAVGVAQRRHQRGCEIWSLEANKVMAEEAKKNWKEIHNQMAHGAVPDDSPFKVLWDKMGKKGDCPSVRILWGSMAEQMMEEGEIFAHPLFEKVRHHYMLHGRMERAIFKEAPRLVMGRGFDLVVLDGGEFSGWGDWLAAQKLSPKIVALDDTQVMKNSDVLADALKKGWKVLAEGSDRNGWAILWAPEPASGNNLILSAPTPATKIVASPPAVVGLETKKHEPAPEPVRRPRAAGAPAVARRR